MHQYCWDAYEMDGFSMEVQQGFTTEVITELRAEGKQRDREVQAADLVCGKALGIRKKRRSEELKNAAEKNGAWCGSRLPN